METRTIKVRFLKDWNYGGTYVGPSHAISEVTAEYSRVSSLIGKGVCEISGKKKTKAKDDSHDSDAAK